MNLDLRADWHYPTRIYFGPGRITELAAICRSLAITRPLLVTDANLASLSFVREAVDENRQSGLPTEVFSDVQSNPTDCNVKSGLAAFRGGKHDGIIALGGGSVMDTGKAIALMSQQSVELWEIAGKWQQIPAGAVAPVVAIPTTSGTGSEVGRAVVITDTRKNVKTIILHPGLMPAAVLADPALTVGLSSRLTAATGMDALAHCLEALCAEYYHPMCDGIAMEGIRYVANWLPRAVQEGGHIEARAHMMAAATMGAVAFQKGLGAIHALSHPLGAVHDMHHGLSNGVLMPYVMTHNRPAICKKMQRLGGFLGIDQAGFDAVLNWILELRAMVGIPHTLREAGITDIDYEYLAIMAAADPCAAENPVPIGQEALMLIYSHAHNGELR